MIIGGVIAAIALAYLGPEAYEWWGRRRERHARQLRRATCKLLHSANNASGGRRELSFEELQRAYLASIQRQENMAEKVRQEWISTHQSLQQLK